MARKSAKSTPSLRRSRQHSRGFSRSWSSYETLVAIDNPDDAEQLGSRLQVKGSDETLVHMDSPDDGYFRDPETLGITDHTLR